MANLGDYSFRKLSDSRLFYLRNPPKFVYIALVIVIVLLAAVLVWACITVKAEEVQNTGIVTDSGSNAIVMDVSGNVKEIMVLEGTVVEEGETLFVLDTSTIEAERESYEKNRVYYGERLYLVQQFIDYLDGKKVSFDRTGLEEEFYNLRIAYDNEIGQLSGSDDRESLRLKYMSSLYSQREQYTASSDTARGYQYQLAGSIEKYDYYQSVIGNDARRIANIDIMLDTLENGSKINPFDDSAEQKEYRDLFKAYLSELDQLDNTNAKEALVLKYQSTLYSQRSQYKSEADTARNYQAAYPEGSEQYLYYQSVIDADNARISYIDIMLSSLGSGSLTNPFEDEGDQKEYYSLFRTYLSDLNGLDNAKSLESVRLKYMSSLYSQREQYRSEKETAESYLASISIDTDQYQYYQAIIDSNAERVGYVDRMLSALERDSLVNPFLSSGAEGEYHNLFETYLSERNQLDRSGDRDSVKAKYMNSMQSEKNTCEQQIRSAKSYISSYDATINKYTKHAVTSGTVHYDSEIRKGSYIQAGSAVGSISPGSGMVVEMYVSAHDRAMFDEGDRCTFTVDGLLQTEYGSVKGEIKAIASDATMSENGAFFKVTVSFDDTELSGKGGDKVSIINGMTVRVWTVYEEATYMQYFLEKLGLR